MGAWGYYDDENDNVADIWQEIMEAVLPKSFHEIENHVTDYEAINRVKINYVNNNEKKLYLSIKKWFTGYKSYAKNYDNPHINIVGIALKAARQLQHMPSSDPLGSGIFDSMIPIELPNRYPVWLRKEALKSVKAQLKNIDDNIEAWKDSKKERMRCNMNYIIFRKGPKAKKDHIQKLEKLIADNKYYSSLFG